MTSSEYKHSALSDLSEGLFVFSLLYPFLLIMAVGVYLFADGDIQPISAGGDHLLNNTTVWTVTIAGWILSFVAAWCATFSKPSLSRAEISIAVLLFILPSVIIFNLFTLSIEYFFYVMGVGMILLAGAAVLGRVLKK